MGNALNEERKLTNEELLKALDICYNDVHCSVDCPYFNLNGKNFCQDKELYKDLKRIVLEHSEQKAEIERLTEWKDKLQDAKDELEQQLIDTGFKEYCEENKRLTGENAELQKQVNELTEKLGKVLSGIKADELLVAKGIEQAVKDTAKEIYDYIKSIEEHGLPTSCVGEWVKNRLKERYGVEVE